MADTTTTPTGAVTQDPAKAAGQSVELPEKFQGPDGVQKLAASYTEAEKALRSAQEERAKEADRARMLEAQLSVLQTQHTQPVHSQPVMTEDDLFRKEWENDPAQAVLNQTRRAEQRASTTSMGATMDLAYDAAKKDSVNFPNFAKYEPEMIQIANANAHLLNRDQLRNPAVIKILYNLARANHIQDEVKEAAQKAQDDAAKLRAAKTKADAEGGSPSAGGGDQKAFSDLSLKEMENVLGFVDR